MTSAYFSYFMTPLPTPLLSIYYENSDIFDFFSIKPKLNIRLFVDLAEFSWIPQFSHDKIVLQIKTKQFDEHIMQKLGNSGKFSKINKQSDVKFWLKWREHGAVSYLLSCTKFHCAMIELD